MCNSHTPGAICCQGVIKKNNGHVHCILVIKLIIHIPGNIVHKRQALNNIKAYMYMYINCKYVILVLYMYMLLVVLCKTKLDIHVQCACNTRLRL